MKRKNLIFAVICTVMAFSLAACGKADKDVAGMQIPNPFVDCATMEEAAKLAGFNMTALEKVDGFDEKSISVIENELFQVVFRNDEDGNEEEICIRKGTVEWVCRRDYFDSVEGVTGAVGYACGTMKGRDGKIMVASWRADGHSYSITSTGISPERMAGLIGEVR